MSAFLLVFAFTLTFVPGMLQPFTESSQEETVVADRIADQLVKGMLVVDTSNPYVLDVDCTIAFFISANNDDKADNNDMPPSSCTFEPIRLQPRVGISQYQDSSTYRHQITVQMFGRDGSDSDDDPDLLCWDVDPGKPIPKSAAECDGERGTDYVLFEVGESTTNTGSVVVARRVVSIDGQDATLLVRVW
ncbi:hypothetical protein BRC77_03815 [Halobacteriales archaeon QH_8_64_26]|nr:MAG: hypothetical protein BRC77_03815 [Halobacteriales archaeon QH_8_64_26]